MSRSSFAYLCYKLEPAVQAISPSLGQISPTFCWLPLASYKARLSSLFNDLVLFTSALQSKETCASYQAWCCLLPRQPHQKLFSNASKMHSKMSGYTYLLNWFQSREENGHKIILLAVTPRLRCRNFRSVCLRPVDFTWEFRYKQGLTAMQGRWAWEEVCTTGVLEARSKTTTCSHKAYESLSWIACASLLSSMQSSWVWLPSVCPSTIMIARICSILSSTHLCFVMRVNHPLQDTYEPSFSRLCFRNKIGYLYAAFL